VPPEDILRERVEALEGTLSAGPCPGGGWSVRATPMTIAVLPANDQAMVRRGLRLILEDQPDITVVAEAVSWDNAGRTPGGSWLISTSG
jgi:hypothetical protein